MAADHSVSEGEGGIGAEEGGGRESFWQQRAGPEPVDLFERAVKRRAGGSAAQRRRTRGASECKGGGGWGHCITEGGGGVKAK